MGHYASEMQCSKCHKIPCICQPTKEQIQKKKDIDKKTQLDIYNWIKGNYKF